MEINTNELNHYGVKGMKWGVRRFRNKNGSRKSRSNRKKTSENPIKQERKRQKKYLLSKRAISVGRSVVNRILESNGSSFRISDSMEKSAQYALGKKYVRDTFK